MGCEGAFRELTKRYGRQFMPFAFKVCKDHHRAEDITQDALLKGFKKIMDGEITSGDHFRRFTWQTLIGELRHIPRDAGREYRKYAGYADMLEHRADGVHPDPRLDPDFIERVRDQLSDQEWDVVRLRVFEGLSNREAADRLGITPEAAYRRYYRAMARLKKWLLSQREEE